MNYNTYEHLQLAILMTEADLLAESLRFSKISCADGTKSDSKPKHHYLFSSQCFKVRNV